MNPIYVISSDHHQKDFVKINGICEVGVSLDDIVYWVHNLVEQGVRLRQREDTLSLVYTQ